MPRRVLTQLSLDADPPSGRPVAMAAASDVERYLEAIVALTRHRDPQELAGALLQTLQRLLPGATFRLLALANENRDTEFSLANIANAVVYDLLESDAPKGPRPLADDPDLLACVREQTLIESVRGPVRRMVFPIVGANHPWALLLVERAGDAAPRALLTKLLSVYSNQAFILSRGQLDPLTGLYNRQSFYDRIRRVAQRPATERRSPESGKAVGHCFALFDIDRFKDVNDRYGHLYGDEVLLLLARLMTRSFRQEDMLFRYGGEEFAAVLVNVDIDGAERLLERFRRTVESYEFPRLEPKTVSIGYTRLDVDQGADKVVMCADKALYYAKRNGRNQVCCYERLIAEGKFEPVSVAEGDIELF